MDVIRLKRTLVSTLVFVIGATTKKKRTIHSSKRRNVHKIRSRIVKIIPLVLGGETTNWPNFLQTILHCRCRVRCVNESPSMSRCRPRTYRHRLDALRRRHRMPQEKRHAHFNQLAPSSEYIYVSSERGE